MEAAYYTKQSDETIICALCPHHCHLQARQRGRCRTRYHDGTKLQALNYGQCTAIALDPIEKKPLYHFHPGSAILSLGSWGCNMACSFCQNWEISQGYPDTQEITPDDAVRLAVQERPRGNIGLAYTYNEPIVWYEFIVATAPLIHRAGLYNVMVTNGFIEQEPLHELLPHIDAWNIDLKAFDQEFYQRLCKADRDPVCRTIETAAATAHVEVTNLIVTGENDQLEKVAALASWLADIRRDIPLHLTRYFPRYHLSASPTPVKTLCQCADIARKYLKNVHIGNVSAADITTAQNSD